MGDLGRLPKNLSAMTFARAGFRVLPVPPNEKGPNLPEWQHKATTDRAQIEKWWEENPNYNIGLLADGFLVVDIDVTNGGLENWHALTELLEPPPTFTVKTPRGGYHLRYSLPEGEQVGNPRDHPARGIDIRGQAGQSLAPGSDIHGKPYRILTEPENGIVPLLPRKRGELPIAVYAPEWLIRMCGKPVGKKSELAGIRLNEETERTVEAAIDYLQNRAPIAIQGEGGDGTTYQVAAELGDIGVDLDTAYHLMLEEWNERCREPWEPDDLRVKVESGYRNRQNAIGIKNPDLGDKVFEGVDFGPGEEASIEDAPPTVQARAKLKKKLGPKEGWQTVGFFEAAARAFTHGNEPLVDGLLDQGAMSVIYGESNSGKSFAKMDMDYHISMGLPWQGMETTRSLTLWLAAEGGNGIYKRFQGLMQHYKPKEEPWFDTLQRPLDLLDPDGDLNGVLDLIKRTEDRTGRAVGNITIDTLSRVLAGGNENGPEDMGQLVRHFDMIRHYSEHAHLCIIHHSGKMAAAGARGHSLLRAATDTEIEVTKEGLFSVKKQRDLDSEWEFKFELRQLQLGKDRRGKEITSAVVIARVRSSGEVVMEPAEREVYDAIIAKLAKDKLPPGTPFDGSFIYDAAIEAGLKRGFKGQIARQRANPSWQRSVGRSRAKLEISGQISSGENDRYIISL